LISVAEVVQDPDLTAPQSYTILRSVGQYVLGGFQSTTTAIPMFGPVQQASDKEINMLPEADRIGGARSFWCVQPIYTTRGAAPVPGVHDEIPTGSGTVYTLSQVPPADAVNVYVNGLLMTPDIDYTIDGVTLTLQFAPTTLYVTWQITVLAGQAASDILVYEGFQYRVMKVYHDFGGGYFKAIATRMQSA
jgi:hypothetical protein